MSKKAFVSYSRKDSDFALKYAGNLKSDFDLWLDQWDIPHLVEGDADWDRAIEKAILECSHFLIILSPQSVQSQEVLGELRLALNKGKTMIPVLYQSCEVPRQLLRIQYINFAAKGNGPDDVSLISQTLRRLRGREILPLEGLPFQIPPPPEARPACTCMPMQGRSRAGEAARSFAEGKLETGWNFSQNIPFDQFSSTFTNG